MKMILLFTHPQAILGVYDFFLSDEKIVLALLSFIIVSGCLFMRKSIKKCALQGPGGMNKASKSQDSF